jgi:ferritin-like metal-binding protein YciE
MSFDIVGVLGTQHADQQMQPWRFDMKTLADAFEHTLKDIYYAESALLKAIPKTAAAAAHKDLKDALKDHAKETAEQLEVLKAVFKTIGVKAEGEKCDAIEGLIKECEGVIEEAKGQPALDASIIGCCQAIEHYEIARYGTLKEWAKLLDNQKGHDLLGQILDMEKAANSKLTHLAVSVVNAVKK